jgi:hypothetical protein
VLRANRHTGTNFYDVQRIQVKREEGYQLVWKIRSSLFTIDFLFSRHFFWPKSYRNAFFTRQPPLFLREKSTM